MVWEYQGNLVTAKFDGTGFRVLVDEADPLQIPKLSHDGQRLAYVKGATTPQICVLNRTGTTCVDAPGLTYDFGWAAGSSKVYFTRNEGDGQIWAIDFGDTSPVATLFLDPPVYRSFGIACSVATGKMIMVHDPSNWTYDNYLSSYDFASGTSTTIYPSNGLRDFWGDYSEVRDEFVWAQYGSSDDGDIWRINGDGSGAVNLTPSTLGEEQTYPQFSPNGAHVFYVEAGSLWVMGRDGSSATNLFILDAGGDPRFAVSRDYLWSEVVWEYGENLVTARFDGTDFRVLVDSAEALSAPKLSFDGQRLAYVKHSATPQICALDRSGSTCVAAPGFTYDFTWGAGSHSVYYTRGEGDGQIWTIDFGAASPVASLYLDPPVYRSFGVAASADGGTMIMIHDPSNWTYNNYIVAYNRASGTSTTIYPSNGLRDFWGDYSPVRDEFVWTQYGSSNDGDIWRVNGDGSGAVNLTPNTVSAEQTYPQFSPNGGQVFYVDAGALWVMGRTGSSPTMLLDLDASRDPRFTVTTNFGWGDVVWEYGDNLVTAQFNGTGYRVLVDEGAPVQMPKFSYGAQRLAYVKRSTDPQICVTDHAGTECAAAPGLTYDFSWRPGTDTIMYTRDEGDGQIWSIDFAAATPVASLFFDPGVYRTFGLAGSADGDTMIMVHDPSNWTYDNYLSAYDFLTGTSTTIYPSNGLRDFWGDYSPVRDEFVWTQYGSSDDGDIWKIGADGSGALNLTPSTPTMEQTYPHFSPDGEHVFYVEAGSLWVMSRGGSSPTMLLSLDVNRDPRFTIGSRFEGLFVSGFESGDFSVWTTYVQ